LVAQKKGPGQFKIGISPLASQTFLFPGNKQQQQKNHTAEDHGAHGKESQEECWEDAGHENRKGEGFRF
jgi:hypothetical protein